MSTPRSSRPNRFQPYVPYRRQAALVEAQRAVEETEARAALAEAQQALEEAEARRSEIRFRSLVRLNPRLAPVAPGAAQATTPAVPPPPDHIKVIVHGQCYIQKNVTLYFAPSCSNKDACIKIYAALGR